ncbi:hypothetical protein ADUPG1_008719 [Aduncisulcus paluster]|uniref:EGF-like domain-containing protein n=1 Tax=Aduncisulcus paluster TaxID=2918883 RepID=A0ABQ5KX42_9EUKA|nr:hypothetical protein ADUPG1_008719 [Aduncisulcus paluster]
MMRFGAQLLYVFVALALIVFSLPSVVYSHQVSCNNYGTCEATWSIGAILDPIPEGEYEKIYSTADYFSNQTDWDNSDNKDTLISVQFPKIAYLSDSLCIYYENPDSGVNTSYCGEYGLDKQVMFKVKDFEMANLYFFIETIGSTINYGSIQVYLRQIINIDDMDIPTYEQTAPPFFLRILDDYSLPSSKQGEIIRDFPVQISGWNSFEPTSVTAHVEISKQLKDLGDSERERICVRGIDSHGYVLNNYEHCLDFNTIDLQMDIIVATDYSQLDSVRVILDLDYNKRSQYNLTIGLMSQRKYNASYTTLVVCDSDTDCQDADGNGGVCYSTNGACQCKDGYVGANCDVVTSDLCSNGSPFKSEKLFCECDDGYTGPFCDSLIGCDGDSLCSNHGLCVSDDAEGFECQCNDGYFGSTCENYTCADDCNSHGECSGPDECNCYPGWANASDGSANCSVCAEGWGPAVDDTDPDGDYCYMAAGTSTCVYGQRVGGDACICDPGYYGDICDTAICSYPAEHAETCATPDHWVCIVGYKGAQCDQVECINTTDCVHGTCDTDPEVCDCDEGWYGDSCNEVEYCLSSIQCVNGQCVDSPDECQCADGWTGDSCTTVDHCTVKCGKHGSCVDSPTICKCHGSYLGASCSVNLVAAIVVPVVCVIIIIILIPVCLVHCKKAKERVYSSELLTYTDIQDGNEESL